MTNVTQAKVDQVKLQEMQVDEAELRKLSQEAVEFFFCALSQDSVVDILKDTDDKENAIGFGLAVKRPEIVVDDPTSVSSLFFAFCAFTLYRLCMSLLPDKGSHTIL